MMRNRKGFGEKTRFTTVVFDCFGEKARGKTFPVKKNWNCDCVDGKVRRGIGAEVLLREDGEPISLTANNAREAFPVAWNDGSGMADGKSMFLVKLDGYLCTLDEQTGEMDRKLKIGTRSSHCSFRGENGKIHNLFCGEYAIVHTVDLSTYSELLTGNLRGHCVSGCRYFALMKEGVLRCSAPYQPNYFLESLGGVSVYLPSDFGEGVGLAAIGDWLYIFMERGIFRLQSRADSIDFLLEPIGYGGREIFYGSVLAVGERIMFLTEQGLHIVKGKEVKKVCEHLDIRPVHGSTVYRVGQIDGMAIFDFCAVREDGYKARRRIAVYTDGSDGFYMDDTVPLAPSGYACSLASVYRFKKNSEEGIYTVAPHLESEKMQLGTSKRKRLKAVRFYGEGEMRLTVKVDRQVHIYDLSFVEGIAQTRLFEKGKSFIFTLMPKAKSVIGRMEVDYTRWED